MSERQPSKLLRTTIVQAFARTLVADRVADSALDSSFASGTRAGGAAPVTFDRTLETRLPDVGDVVGGHYRLQRLLGQGMFGKVYVAQRLDVPEHQVALKLLPRALYASRNVERELVMLATVGHPHVVQLKDHGTTPECVWLTMPVYQGETLAERLAKRGPLSPRQAYDIFLPVARGLEALHSAGLRHQDVKPENIFLAVFGGRVHPVLLDLGVAAEKDAEFIAGTALYAAPEQLAALSGLPSGAPLSEKMDTYGLAATLLLALVGPAHFPGEKATTRSELAEAQEVRTSEPISMGALAEVTGDPRDQLQACFRQWLSFSPADRPSMRELAEALEVLLEPDLEEERRERRRSERQATTILGFKLALAGMLLIGAAGAALAFSQRQTLQVAADLRRAQQAGEERFHELSTCNAAHGADTQALLMCRAEAERTREEYRRELDDLTRSGSSSQNEAAQRAQRYMNKLKACEDVNTQQKLSCDDAVAAASLAAQRDRANALAERAELEHQLDVQKTLAAQREAERDVCQGDRASVIEERDTLKAALTKAQAAPPRPAPGVHAVASGGPAPDGPAPDGPKPPSLPPTPTASPPASTPAPHEATDL